MNIDKRKICDWLAGTAGSEAMRAVEADVRDRDRSETLAWLARLDDASQRLRQAVDSGGLARWLDEEDDPIPDAGEARGEEVVFRDEPAGMLVGTRGVSPWVVSGGSGRWPLSIPDDEVGRALARVIGERCYGSPDQAVALTLHVTEDDDEGGQVRAGLEVSPPPLREPLVITVEFGTGDRRTFTAAVPVSPRPSTRSAPCEPLPPGSARARSGVWIDGGWPPVFKLS